MEPSSTVDRLAILRAANVDSPLRVNDPAVSSPAPHLAVLDGLRGLAIAIVLASHLSNLGFFGPGLALRGTGKSGVYLFFVLSAFLLTRLWLAKSPAQWRQGTTWLDYGLRRVLRIWPLYLLVLGVSWAVSAQVPWWHYRIDTPTLLRHLTLQEGQSVLWSIPVEFKAYLLLPAVAGMVWAGRGSPAWVSALAFALAVVLAGHIWPASDMAGNDVELGFYLPLFLLGSAAAWADWRWPRPPAAVGRWAAWAVPGLLLVFLATTPWALSLWAGRDLGAGANAAHITAFGLLWAMLLLALVRAPAGVQRPFARGPLRWLGWVSFSAYLWHMVVLDAWRTWFGIGGMAGAAGATLLVLAVSALSWRLVERPFQRVRWPGVRTSAAD